MKIRLDLGMQKRRLEKGIPCSDSVGSIIQLSSKKDTQYVDVNILYTVCIVQNVRVLIFNA
jgi:hypothetical protein